MIGYPAKAGGKMYASNAKDVLSLSDDFLQTEAFVDTGSSGGPVVNEAGAIVAVVSQGGGVVGGVPVTLGGQQVHLAGHGDTVEPAKARPVTFLRDEHFGTGSK